MAYYSFPKLLSSSYLARKKALPSDRPVFGTCVNKSGAMKFCHPNVMNKSIIAKMKHVTNICPRKICLAR